jgi:hypothetical protein
MQDPYRYGDVKDETPYAIGFFVVSSHSKV